MSPPVVRRRRKLFQESSPLQPLNGFAGNFMTMFKDKLATNDPHFGAIRKKKHDRRYQKKKNILLNILKN